MKRYTLSRAGSFKHVPEYPERTAHRNCHGVMNFDVEYQVWPNRASMLKTIDIQERASNSQYNWRETKTKAEGK